jgi:uncharacterized protein (TIGR00255 family)
VAYSMTGYGRAEAEAGHGKATVEVKSVNHRFLEVNVKSAARLFRLDDAVRKVVKERFGRGYFDVAVSLAVGEGGRASAVGVNEPLLAGYMKAASDVAGRFGVSYPPSFEALLTVKDLFTVDSGEVDFDVWWPTIETALSAALEKLAEARRIEGDNTAAVVGRRFESVAGHIAKIRIAHEASSADRYERLKARLEKLVGEGVVEEARLAQEAAMLVDKAAIDEEIDRVGSHLSQVAELLRGDEGVGRKLEFFVQEINREVNTIGSKTASSEATVHVVEIKSELEKVREQSQNLE